jgi:hypothetical protein
MAQRVKISCINKNDRYSAYEKISHVGGVNDNGTRWKLTISEAIRSIENGTYSFYTSVGGHTRNVVVSSRNGSKYLRTEADADTPDNLLSLQECP